MLTRAEMQRLRSLREKNNREALGLFVIEGRKVVTELRAAGFLFVEVYATAAWAEQDSVSRPAVEAHERVGVETSARRYFCLSDQA